MPTEPAEIWARLRAEAQRGGLALDHAAYQAAALDAHTPVLLGSGSLTAPIGFMGRDPGRTEVALREPFVGAGGRLIRDGLHRRRYGSPAPDMDAAIAAGRDWFWCNTVPYKPLGNKAWSMAVKRRFAPIIASMLVQQWTGHHLLTCGREALDWFRILEPGLKPVLHEAWTRPDAFSQSLTVVFLGKTIHLHPLPHPSPLNARWHHRFPGLLQHRLEQLSTP